MKRLTNATLIALLLIAVTAFGQSQSITFNDNNGDPLSGTYNSTASFSLNVLSTYSGYNTFGIFYWLEVPSAVAGNFSLTNVTFPSPFFSDPNSLLPATLLFNNASGADPGFLVQSLDLGSNVPDTSQNSNAIAPGTYLYTTFTVNLNGLAPGTYQLKTTSSTPRGSYQFDEFFNNRALPQATYTINVVPEPAPWSLVGLGGLGAAGLTWLRARRK